MPQSWLCVDMSAMCLVCSEWCQWVCSCKAQMCGMQYYLEHAIFSLSSLMLALRVLYCDPFPGGPLVVLMILVLPDWLNAFHIIFSVVVSFIRFLWSFVCILLGLMIHNYIFPCLIYKKLFAKVELSLNAFHITSLNCHSLYSLDWNWTWDTNIPHFCIHDQYLAKIS